jgi:hypothetical protein
LDLLDRFSISLEYVFENIDGSLRLFATKTPQVNEKSLGQTSQSLQFSLSFFSRKNATLALSLDVS